MARLRRPLRLLAAASAGLVLASCGSGAALSEARTACHGVQRSLATYAKAQQAKDPVLREQLTAKAQSLLLAAQAPAARATSGDGSFNALQTSISEASRVPEGLLVESLRRECQVVLSNSPYLAS